MKKEYNVLIVGAGNIGAFFDTPSSQNILTHAHAFTKIKEFNLLGFVDSNKEKAQAAAKLWNTACFKNLNEAFDKNKIDVVSLCAPDEFHYELLNQLANSPIKLVFAEKPLAKKSKEAKAIIELYKKKNIECLLNYSRRFVYEFKELKDKISLGDCGNFICGNGYYGKGILHNGSHLIDFLRYIIGEIKDTQTFGYNFDFYKDDPSVSAVVNFEKGGIITILNMPCSNYTIFELDLLFQKKRIKILDSGFKVEIYEVLDNEMFKGYKNLVKHNEYNTSLGNALENAAQNIYNHFKFNEELKCTLEDGYRAIEICESLGKVSKMNKKILLFSRDPGGANAVAPLYYKLKNKGYDVKIFGKDFALDKYKQYDINGIDIETKIKDISQNEIEKFLIEEKPDFIITGTSADDFTEKFLWKAAEKLNIKSFAILDQWINYGIRFSGFSVNQLKEYEKNRQHPYLPFKILVMDDYAKEQMVLTGISEDKILVSGQPYLDYLMEKKENLSKDSVKYKENIGCREEEFLLTFVSEPILDTYNESDNSEHYWGYTERTIFKQLLEVLKNITEEYKKKIKIIIRLHSKEKENSYNDIIASINSKYISILVDKKIDGFTLMLASDLICGISSMFLIEAAALGKPIQSIQIGLKRENNFVLDKKGIIKSIIHKEDLKNKIENSINKNRIIKYDLNINYGSIYKVVEFIEQYIK